MCDGVLTSLSCLTGELLGEERGEVLGEVLGESLRDVGVGLGLLG